MKRLLLAGVVAVALVLAGTGAARADDIDTGSGGCYCGGDNPPSTWGWGLRYYPGEQSYHWHYCYGGAWTGRC